MSKNKQKEVKLTVSEKKRHEDIVLTRFFITFLAIALAVVALMRVNALVGDRQAFFINHILPWVQLALGIATAACAVWFILCRRAGKNEMLRRLSSYTVFPFVACLFALSVSYIYIGLISGLIAGLLILLFGCFVASFYPRSFFVFTVFTGVGALLFWMLVNRPFTSATTGSVLRLAAALILPVAVAAAALLLGKRLERLLGGFVWTERAALPFVVMAVTLVVASLAVVLTAAAPAFALISRIAAAAVGAVYLACAIHCTVKMI